jgi:hypothetical protein
VKRTFLVTLAASLTLALPLGAQVSQGTVQRAQPIKPGEVPARKKAATLPPRGTYAAPRTPWGDP